MQKNILIIITGCLNQNKTEILMNNLSRNNTPDDNQEKKSLNIVIVFHDSVYFHIFDIVLKKGCCHCKINI